MRRDHTFDLDTLGGRIGHALRETAGPSKQAWLGEEVGGVGSTTVSRWISNQTLPKPDHLKRIVETLSISGHWLLTGDGLMYEMPSLAIETMGRMDALLRNYLSAAKDPYRYDIGFCHLDDHLRFIEIDSWLAGINGLHPEDLIGKAFSEVLPAVFEIVGGKLQRVLDTGESVIDGLTRVTRADGIERFYRQDYYAVKGDDGTTIGIKCVVREIVT